jgi:hypothetical protein
MLSFFGFERNERRYEEISDSPNKCETLYPDGSYRMVANDSHSSFAGYKSAMAAISRAITRLVQRGMVKRSRIYGSSTTKTCNTWILLTEAARRDVK